LHFISIPQMKKNLKYVVFCFLLLHCVFLKAQVPRKAENNRTIDSLLNVLKIFSVPNPEVKLAKGADTVQVNVLNLLSKQYQDIGNFENALLYAQKALNNASLINFQKGMSTAHNYIGWIYSREGNFEKALDNYRKSVIIWEQIGDKKEIARVCTNIALLYGRQGIYDSALYYNAEALSEWEAINNKQGVAASYNNIGSVNERMGNYEKALTNYLKSLKVCEEITFKPGMAGCYGNIGTIYAKIGNFEKALENNLKSLSIKIEIGNKQNIAGSYNNIGAIYYNQKKYDDALVYYFKSLDLMEELGNKQGIAMCYNNIGIMYETKGDYDKALEVQLKALKIREEIALNDDVIPSYNNIGSIYIKKGKFDQAYNYLNKALTAGKKIGQKESILDTYSSLSELFLKKGDYKQAFTYHRLFSSIKDSLLNEQSSKQISEMNVKYDSEKKDKELIKKDAEISHQQAEMERKNLQRNAFIAGFIFVLVLAFFVYGSYRQKQSANRQLEEKNSVIEKQKHLVEGKNEKITDSITYAKRIQHATLPSEEVIKTAFTDTFILFLPKDIVSGDFYWYSEIARSPENGERNSQHSVINTPLRTPNSRLSTPDSPLLTPRSQLIAVADCTGHGVPGAFMSMIGNTLLNEIVNVKGICKPAEILTELNKGVVSLLNQSSEDINSQEDGMDITIVSIDQANNTIEYAAANHSSYLVSGNQITVLKGEVYSIGGMFGKPDIEFTSQKIPLEKGSTLYLFTDGFADQFGGEKNGKYTSSRFEQLIQSIHGQNMKEQKASLAAAFENWKGNRTQLDDILIMGIRI
jgi:tetratricopeptide (TPR) repeat protein